MSSRNVPDGFHSAVRDAFKEIDAMTPHEKSKGRVAKTAIAIIMCITLVSVSAFACNEIYNKWFKKTGDYSGKITVEDVDFETAPQYVALELTYLPDDFTEFEAPYKYHYKGEFGLSFNLWKMSSVDKNEYKNIVSTEQTVFGENQAEILTINGSDAKLALIYFEKMGTVVECYFNKSIPNSEMKAVLNGLRLVEATEDNGLIYDGTNEIASKPWVDNTQLPVNVCNEAIDYDIATWAKYNVKIVESKVLDSINGIDESCMLEDFVSEFADENGNLKEYRRENIIYGDGVNTLDYVEGEETVGRKIVAVTYEVENVNDTTGEFYCNLNLCDSSLSFIQTEAFAVSGQDAKSNKFYYVPVKAGESKTVTVYSVVDADIDFDNLYAHVLYKNIFEEQTKQDILKVEL